MTNTFRRIYCSGCKDVKEMKWSHHGLYEKVNCPDCDCILKIYSSATNSEGLI